MHRSILAFSILGCLAAVQAIIGNYRPSDGLLHIVVALGAVSALTIILTGTSRNIILMLASFCVGICLLEASALLLEKPKAAWIDGGLRQPRPVVGFGAVSPGRYITKKIAPDGRIIFDTVATIGNDLLRVTNAPSGSGAVAFFGDSFTFGSGISDTETITQAFADLTKRSIPAPNLSFPAWSPAQNLAMIQKGLNKEAYRGARRFVLMTGAWHMDRTACLADYVDGAPRFLLKDGKLVVDGACSTNGFMRRMLHSFALYRNYIAPRLIKLHSSDVATYYAIVDEFVRTAKQKYGIETTIIDLPEQTGFLKQLGSTEAEHLERLRKSGADVIADSLPQETNGNLYVIADDGHPTGFANRALAQILVRHFAEIAPGLLSPALAHLP